ncbi:hypothetical protein ABPG77_000705 [Micractinium sp. CCAP 211/92]
MVKQSPRQRRAKAVTSAVRSVGATKRNTAAAPPAAPAGGAGKPKRPPTDFEQRLYDLCKCIPAGRVATYGIMAQVLGSAPRACGQALRRNPYAPTVPCHRVIAASLELGGFSGSWGMETANVKRKRSMLAEEGVQFDAAGRLLPSAAGAVMPASELAAAAAKAGMLRLAAGATRS